MRFLVYMYYIYMYYIVFICIARIIFKSLRYKHVQDSPPYRVIAETMGMVSNLATQIALTVPSLFAPGAKSLPGTNRPIGAWPIRPLANSLRGPFTPWPFHSLANSFPGALIPGHFAP